MDFRETIEKPWREPMDYLTLVFWFVIFIIIAVAMYDTMRVLAMWIAQSAKDAVT